MNQEHIEKMVRELTYVRMRDRQIPLTFTGGRSSGGFTSAFEFANPETDDRYYLKVVEIGEGSTDEIAVLGKVNQIFRNEILSEPDAAKRLNYMPVPEILTDDPDRFNVEFMRSIDRSRYKIQLQTAGIGTPAEKQLPDSMHDRLRIALDFAKTLRCCAKNRFAYVDIKPLEHIYWAQSEGGIRITVIDWGISRANATPFLLTDDIRKFCMFLPELIYGRKMLDLINRGKFEYPIQKENDPVLVRLLGQLSFNNNNPPLNQRYALLLGELLTGSSNEARIQNRCVEVWDGILRILNEAIDMTGRNDNNVQSWESLARDAETLIDRDPESFSDRDFRKALDPRTISLTSYKAWLLPEIRFLQLWYGKIDLIPHQTFDQCVSHVLAGNPGELEKEFRTVITLIGSKLPKVNGNGEITAILLESLTQVQTVIEAWKATTEVEKGLIQPDIFQTTYSSSNLRVIDPIVAEMYRKQSKKVQSALSEPKADEPQEAKPAKKSAEKPTTEETPKPKSEAGKKAQALLDVFSRKETFADLRSIGFFAELSELITRYPNDKQEIGEILEPVFTSLFSTVENWITKVNSDRFVVSDEDLSAVDWTTMLPQPVADWNVLRKGQPLHVSEYIRGQLFALQNELARASSASIELNLNLQIRDLLNRIKALRKKLDTENMAQFKAIVENGDYDTAKQIIDLHYLENPQLYERLRSEMKHQQAEGDDKKSMALINSLLNDLTSGGGNMETGKYIKNQNNIPYINQKISSFRQKNAQLFDIQDELIRTKNLANDARKASADSKHITMINVILLVVVIVMSVVLLAVILAKNFGLESTVTRLESNLSSFQATYDANEKATPLPIIFPTSIPQATAMPTVTQETVPTMAPIEDTSPTADPNLSAADRHLNALIGAQVSFNLDGNVNMYDDNTLTEEKKVGIIINYLQNVNGKLIGYDAQAINLEIPFNIGRSQISSSNMMNVVRGTNIRQYSDVPAETTAIFITQTEVVLTSPASDCTDSQFPFCHGTISVWIPRSSIEASIK